MLKNVILDMGNVLLDFDPEYALTRFCASEESRAVIRRELFEGPQWIAGDRGDITNEQRFELAAPRVPEKYREELKTCVERWDECMVPLPGAPEFLQALRARGLGVYVLSNACSRFYSYFPKSYPLSFFDGVVVSSDEHLVKPDPELYRILLTRYGLSPGECLFVDDTQANIDGALRAGIPGYRFDGDYARLTRHIDALLER